MDKPVILAIHIACAVTALSLGGLLLASRKGTKPHRYMGRIWGVAMTGVVVTSFIFPAERLLMIAGVSYLHVLSLATLFILPTAVWAARTHRVKLHRNCMLTLYGFLCFTGVAALFMPGRFLYQLFFA
jgi:uncharacterized membrane protein